MILKQNKKVLFLLIAVILLTLSKVIFTFAFEKDLGHCDEPWSYGLANSYYEPYIFEDADETHFTNNNQWISSKVFRDYMTVQDGEKFTYDSVWYNQSKDLHPPLFYVVLHTICSLFPDSYSRWYGFIINIIVFIITQLFLFLIARNISKSNAVGIFTCFFYGFSTGALNTFIFVRMYAMSTMWAVMLIYYHQRLAKSQNFKRNLPPIIIITILGALTHHFFLLFACILSACFCFYYLFSKQFKKMFIYAFCLMASAGTSILLFPATINHLFFRRGNIITAPFFIQLRYFSSIVIDELFGIEASPFGSYSYAYFIAVFVGLAVIAAPLCVLFRKESWFIKLKTDIADFFRNFVKLFKSLFKPFPIIVVSMIICCISVVLFVAKSISMFSMMAYTDRYMFIIYPFICLLFVLCLNFIFKHISLRRYKNTIISVILVITTLSFNMNTESCYIFDRDTVGKKTEEITKDANVILLIDKYWTLTYYQEVLLNSNQIFVTNFNTCMNFADEINKIDKEHPLYLIFETYNASNDSDSADSSEASKSQSFKDVLKGDSYSKSEYIKFFSELDIADEFSLVSMENVINKEIEIYRLSK